MINTKHRKENKNMKKYVGFYNVLKEINIYKVQKQKKKLKNNLKKGFKKNV